MSYPCRHGCGRDYPSMANRHGHEAKCEKRPRPVDERDQETAALSSLYTAAPVHVEAEPLREFKAKVPTRYVTRLHAMKILSGKSISQLTTEALALYFQRDEKAATTLSALLRFILAITVGMLCLTFIVLQAVAP